MRLKCQINLTKFD